MRRMILLLNTVLLFGMFGPAAAQDSLPPAPYAYRQLDDPQQEAAAQDLMETLRCLKCQSQSIADSDAPMAGDMRHQVRIRIAAGESPEEVRGWLMQRYGDYVSYKPDRLAAAPTEANGVGFRFTRRRPPKAPAHRPEDPHASSTTDNTDPVPRHWQRLITDDTTFTSSLNLEWPRDAARQPHVRPPPATLHDRHLRHRHPRGRRAHELQRLLHRLLRGY